MTQHLQIDQIIDPSDATVIVQRDAAGRPLDAHFDMSGLPRVDTMMIGRPATEVPVLAERLCGICPVAHHLAGIQALEALSRPIALSSTAKAVRQLLNYGSVVDGHLLGFIGENLEAVKVLRRFARLVMGAAGSPKHFPTTAVPGGVTKTVDLMDLAVVIGALPIAQAAAEGLVQAHLDDESVGGVFTGADVALVGPNGQIDLMGGRLRAAAVDGSVIVEGALPEQWDDTIREAVPGSAAPRPYLVALGPQKGQYRTGPVAQLRVGRLSTPLAAAAQMRWLGGGARATSARAIIILHCIEAISRLCDSPELLLTDIGSKITPVLHGGIGVGWIETGRGLLVHRYATNPDGTVVSATILTPTAQNEPWLATLLRQACDTSNMQLAMEDAIREADPCLPCSTAPKGQMGLVIQQDAAIPVEVLPPVHMPPVADPLSVEVPLIVEADPDVDVLLVREAPPVVDVPPVVPVSPVMEAPPVVPVPPAVNVPPVVPVAPVMQSFPVAEVPPSVNLPPVAQCLPVMDVPPARVPSAPRFSSVRKSPVIEIPPLPEVPPAPTSSASGATPAGQPSFMMEFPPVVEAPPVVPPSPVTGYPPSMMQPLPVTGFQPVLQQSPVTEYPPMMQMPRVVHPPVDESAPGLNFPLVLEFPPVTQPPSTADFRPAVDVPPRDPAPSDEATEPISRVPRSKKRATVPAWDEIMFGSPPVAQPSPVTGYPPVVQPSPLMDFPPVVQPSPLMDFPPLVEVPPVAQPPSMAEFPPLEVPPTIEVPPVAPYISVSETLYVAPLEAPPVVQVPPVVSLSETLYVAPLETPPVASPMAPPPLIQFPIIEHDIVSPEFDFPVTSSPWVGEIANQTEHQLSTMQADFGLSGDHMQRVNTPVRRRTDPIPIPSSGWFLGDPASYRRADGM